jgi:hypothetical protein
MSNARSTRPSLSMTIGERLVLDWDDEGEVVYTLEEVPDGTHLSVREVSGEWSTARELRASALAWTPA